MQMIAIGWRIYGLGAVLLGIVELAYGAFAEVWLPVPTHLPGYHVLAYATASLLVLAGLAINSRRAAPIAALVLAAIFGLGMLAADLPHTLATPTVWGAWQSVPESTVMALGGVLAYAYAAGIDEARSSAIA